MRSSYDILADDSERSHWQTLRSLLPFLWPRDLLELKVRVIVAVCLLFSAKLVQVYVPFLLKAAVDGLNGLGGNPAALPLGLILAYGAARVAAQAFGELRDAVFAKVGQHALRTVALRTFEHVHALSLRFHLERRTGGMSRVIERGTKGIDFLLRFTLFNILPTLFEILLVCGILLFAYGWDFALITFVSVALYIYFTFSVTEWRLKYRREMNRTDTEANTRAIDSLLNFETVKYFGAEDHEARRFDSAMARYQKAAVTSQVSLSVLNIGQGFIIAGGMCGVMALAGSRVVDGTMTLGDFVLVNTILIQLYQPLGFLGTVYREIKQSLVDMEKMFEMMQVEPEIADIPDAVDLQADGGEVVFDNVSFHYDENRPIIKNISFKVPAGKTVAIVGPSGAGKSTLSRILYRFYDLQSGAVYIDGQNIAKVKQKSLRSAIGIVPQDTVLFNDTIGYNIRYGQFEADDLAVVEAAKLARIHEFVDNLPDGYQSMVGERGLKLSGGEKQRVAIARTILKNPPILLLDEATSALDSHTEQAIQDSLRHISESRTTLVIAHRLSTVVDADEIIVLEQGEIVERGTHSVLIEKGAVYAGMWAKQQEAAAAEEKLNALKVAEPPSFRGTI